MKSICVRLAGSSLTGWFIASACFRKRACACSKVSYRFRRGKGWGRRNGTVLWCHIVEGISTVFENEFGLAPLILCNLCGKELWPSDSSLAEKTANVHRYKWMLVSLINSPSCLMAELRELACSKCQSFVFTLFSSGPSCLRATRTWITACRCPYLSVSLPLGRRELKVIYRKPLCQWLQTEITIALCLKRCLNKERR